MRTMAPLLPVHVDTAGIFIRENPHIPREAVYHTFLLDKDNRVVLVGNPSRSEKIKEMFWQIVEEKLANENKMKRIIRHIPSLLLGACFVASGWLKGVDPYGTSLKLSEYFRSVGLERLRGRPSLGMVGVSLCRGVVLGAAPALGRVPQGGGLGYGGGDVCLYRADGLAGFLACGDVGAGLRLFRRCFHVGARGYAVEKRVAVGFGGLAFVGSADGVLARPERMAHGFLLCDLLLWQFPLYSAVWLPRWISCLSAVGRPLSAVPGFGVYDGRYEEVTDSLMEVSGQSLWWRWCRGASLRWTTCASCPAFVPKAGAGRISFCLWTLPGQNGGADMDVFYTDEVTLKSLLRAGAGLVVVDGGIVRAKRNLSVFRPVRFGRNVTVGEMMGRGRRPAVALRRLRVGGPGGDGLGAP